jgi:3'-5' exoribonuclease
MTNRLDCFQPKFADRPVLQFSVTTIPVVSRQPTSADDLVPSRLPTLFRLTSIERLSADRGFLNRATIFHERAALTVSWTSREPDVNLTRGCLVGIRWAGVPTSENGAIRIARLVRLDRPMPTENLFETIPTTWVKDRDLVRRARDLCERLPLGFAHLFNAILWDGKRLQRYLTGPSSLSGHHQDRNGNFRHSVEVAEQALAVGVVHQTAFPPVLILGGLLHDAGKADEYDFDRVRQRFSLSARGTLIGHRHTVLEWVAAARAQHRVLLPDAHYLALVHVLTAARGAPKWLGMREPKSLDATILSMADRLSGEGDLHRRFAPAQEGFGGYHAHLGGRPYVASQPDSGAAVSGAGGETLAGGLA